MLRLRAMDYGEVPRGIVFTLLAVARFGDAADFAQARTYLERAAEARTEVVERYALGLFDAYVAARSGSDADVLSGARRAADGFRRLGYPLLEAAALEAAGDVSEALSIYRRLGANGDIARLGLTAAAESAPNVEPPDVLSAREQEIAAFVALGRSNIAIARALSISNKTVEKHLGNIYAKLGFSSRVQLAMHVATNGSFAAR